VHTLPKKIPDVPANILIADTSKLEATSGGKRTYLPLPPGIFTFSSTLTCVNEQYWDVKVDQRDFKVLLYSSHAPWVPELYVAPDILVKCSEFYTNQNEPEKKRKYLKT
jgi:hypothetical protein